MRSFRPLPGRAHKWPPDRLPLSTHKSAEPPFATYAYQDYKRNQPTAAYVAFFLLWWVPAILAVPASLTLLGLGIAWLVDDVDSVPRYAVAFGVAAALALYTILLRLHTPRVLIRAGAFPALCLGDATPTTEEALRSAVRKILARTGKPPTVVGSGWGYFLTREGAKGTRLFLHAFKGRQPDAPQRWRSGTTIAEVSKTLLKEEGVTFSSHPTMDYIGLGSWYARGNHGNTGDSSKGSSKSLRDARVLNMTTDTIERMEYPAIRRLFDGVGGDDPAKYMILDMALQNLVPNDDIQKKGIIIDSPEAAAEWLAPGSHLRVCFQGAARSYALGIRWQEIYEETKHRDPHFGSRLGLYFQADICSVICGCHEPMSAFRGITSRYNANRWMPVIFPIETVTVLLSGIRNFEIVFQLGKPLDGATMYAMIRSLIELHKVIGGRSEIRYSKSRATSPVYLDCAVARGSDRIFALLQERFGVTRCSLHPGKHTALSTAPLERVPLAETYGMLLS